MQELGQKKSFSERLISNQSLDKLQGFVFTVTNDKIN
jgi:hypothetical protein